MLKINRDGYMLVQYALVKSLSYFQEENVSHVITQTFYFLYKKYHIEYSCKYTY